MKISKLLTSCAAAAIFALPSWGATTARNQIRNVAFDAMTTETDAGKLWSYNSDGLDWMAQGGQLMVLRDDLNNLGRTIHNIQSQPLPVAEQRMVRRVARDVNLMANHTEDAILWGRTHRQDLFNPNYAHTVSLIYSNAEHLDKNAKAMMNFVNSNESTINNNNSGL